MSIAKTLTDTIEKLSSATSLNTITQAVAEAARQISGSDGSTFVLRDEDRCYYVDENAISPLWKGRKFPLESCISGWCMNHRETVLISDIYKDQRIPHDAYRPTFVKSLCMVPIRSESPIGAIGNYWSKEYQPMPEEIKLLQILANSSAVALENLSLRNSIVERSAERDVLLGRQQQLEFQLHSLAHDMRNPLASIIGFSDLLARHRSKLEPQLQTYLDSIIRTGNRLNWQITRMLALYQLSNQSVRKQPVNLSAIASEVVDGLAVQYSGHKTELEIAPELRAQADPDLIRMALENLFSNAFKYSSRKNAIWIRFCSKEDNFIIEDRGDGFHPDQAKELFKPLVRLHKQSEFSGTGLGLASVARIIELHGGTISAEGRPREGATFSFKLPI